MAVLDSILSGIGNTPLIQLRRMGSDLSARLFAKAEFLNPGGSCKDRIGLAMIEAAERDGRLRPGATIVEATAGNTGIGLALAAIIKGYRVICVLPDKMCVDKIRLLQAYGAKTVITPTAVPPDSPENYNNTADRLARELPGSFRPGQFTNPANPDIHYRTTGPEIWRDLEGSIDVLVAGIGTGGTLSGAGRFLKEQDPNIRVVGADPEGSILSGDEPKPYRVEGIGEDFFPGTYDPEIVDEWIRISDKESFHTARRLAREEGILVGGSSGTAMAAALRYARRTNTSLNIVVVFPDTGRNYISAFYSDDWLNEKGLA